MNTTWRKGFFKAPSPHIFIVYNYCFVEYRKAVHFWTAENIQENNIGARNRLTLTIVDRIFAYLAYLSYKLHSKKVNCGNLSVSLSVYNVLLPRTSGKSYFYARRTSLLCAIICCGDNDAPGAKDKILAQTRGKARAFGYHTLATLLPCTISALVGSTYCRSWWWYLQPIDKS